MRRQFLVALAGPTRGGFRTAGPGALAALAETISAQGINIRAIGGAEIGGTGGLALMVNDDQEDGLEQLLRSAGYTAVEVESVEVELEDRPADSQVASTDQDRFGTIFRRNMPYGTVTDHGTMFVGFSSTRQPLATMLESMAGLAGGVRDALTLYTRPLTGAYYFVPSTDTLRRVGDTAASAG